MVLVQVPYGWVPGSFGDGYVEADEHEDGTFASGFGMCAHGCTAPKAT